jgi:hypothetical protein
VAWEVNDEEFTSILALPANRRYGYFVKRAASHGEVWSLRGDGGWVVAADDHDNPTSAFGHTLVSPRPALKGRGTGRNLSRWRSTNGSKRGFPNSKRTGCGSLSSRPRKTKVLALRRCG